MPAAESSRSGRVGTIIGGAIVFAIFALGLKSFIVTVWAPPKQIARYAIVGDDGRSLEIYLFPDRRAVFRHADSRKGLTEGSLARLRGSFGTHYFGRLWHVDAPGVPFGYRIYPSGCKPVVMEIDTLAHYQHGVGDPSLPASKQRAYSILCFCTDSLGFEGMELRTANVDVASAEERLRVFEAAQGR